MNDVAEMTVLFHRQIKISSVFLEKPGRIPSPPSIPFNIIGNRRISNIKISLAIKNISMFLVLITKLSIAIKPCIPVL